MERDSLPDLAGHRRYRVVEDAPVWGVAVPGLRAVYWRRDHDGRTATVGVFTFQQLPVFMAWGYADEQRCRYHSFRTQDGGWEQPRPGCPRIRAIQHDGTVTGLQLRTREATRVLPVHPPASVPVSAATVASAPAERRTAANENPVNVNAVTNNTACSTGLTIGTNPITATGS